MSPKSRQILSAIFIAIMSILFNSCHSAKTPGIRMFYQSGGGALPCYITFVENGTYSMHYPNDFTTELGSWKSEKDSIICHSDVYIGVANDEFFTIKSSKTHIFLSKHGNLEDITPDTLAAFNKTFDIDFSDCPHVVFKRVKTSK